MALFNFNKAPTPIFETRARHGETGEAKPHHTAESAPLVAERLSVLQEESTTEGMTFSAKRGIGFLPSIVGDTKTPRVRAGILGDTGVSVLAGGLLAVLISGAALLLGVIDLEQAQGLGAIASIVMFFGAVAIGVDGGR